MYLRHENIAVPYINYNGSVESLAADVGAIGNSLRDTIDNVQDISHFIESYLDHVLQQREKEITEKIASRMYDIISEMIESNIRKEEFLDLLLRDETSDAYGQM